MTNANVVQRHVRALNYSATLLVAALLAYAIFLVAQSWREAKSGQSSRLESVAELSGIAIDTYFTQLEIGMRNLGADLDDTGNKPNLDRAFKLVSRFQKLHGELGNVLLIRGDGQLLLTGNVPNNPDLPTLGDEASFMEFRSELQHGPAFALGKPVLGT